MPLPKIPFDPSCDWHVLLAGQRLGPYTRAALCQLLETHPDGWEASVWRPGMLDWRPAQRVDALVQEGGTPAHGVGSQVAAGEETSSVRGLSSVSMDSTPSEIGLPRVWAQRPPSLQGMNPHSTLPQPPREAAVFMQTPARSHRPPPEFAETTRDMATFKPPQSQRFRTLGLVMVIGGLCALSLVLVVMKLNATPKHASASATVAAKAAAPPSSQEVESPPVPERAVPTSVASEHRAAHANTAARPTAAPDHAPKGSERAQAQAELTSIRVRARLAPVRAAPDPAAKVLCSVKRGTAMRSFEQRPGTRKRWFAVHCDKDTSGWIHENFLARLRP